MNHKPLLLRCLAKKAGVWLLACFMVGSWSCHVWAQDAEPACYIEKNMWSIHGQFTMVPQGRGHIHSPYQGPHSLQARRERATSYTATAFLGMRLFWPGSALFVNPEISAGRGLSSTHGIGGFTNGEIYRVDTVSPRYNWSRLFIQQIVGLSTDVESLISGPNQLTRDVAVERLTLVLGKFSLSDYFDNNWYSHDPRSQFLNWAIMDTGAWDYAADTRGYTEGAYIEYKKRHWAIRLASVLEPAVANGLDMDTNITKAHSENFEIEVSHTLGRFAGQTHLLLFANHAHMGWYADALADDAQGPPNVTTTRRYRRKLGIALNVAQSLGGNDGLFMRFGIADGRSEAWAYTEIDQTWVVGVQLDGAHWGRPADRFGLAWLMNGLSDSHADYLAAGGVGFMLGDLKLSRGIEKIGEMYYSWAPCPWFALSADVQTVQAPGYNLARGPALIGALRLHLAY